MAAHTAILATCILFALYASTAYAGKRTLVLVDNWSIRETHSTYFRTLRGKCIENRNVGLSQQAGFAVLSADLIFGIINLIIY